MTIPGLARQSANEPVIVLAIVLLSALSRAFDSPRTSSVSFGSSQRRGRVCVLSRRHSRTLPPIAGAGNCVYSPRYAYSMDRGPPLPNCRVPIGLARFPGSPINQSPWDKGPGKYYLLLLFATSHTYYTEPTSGRLRSGKTGWQASLTPDPASAIVRGGRSCMYPCDALETNAEVHSKAGSPIGQAGCDLAMSTSKLTTVRCVGVATYVQSMHRAY